MSSERQFLTSVTMLHCGADFPDGPKQQPFTNIYYTFKGRHFSDSFMGHLSDAHLEEKVEGFLRDAAKCKHDIEVLPPSSHPRHLPTLREAAATNKLYRDQTAAIKRVLTKVRTAAIGVLTRQQGAPAQPDTTLAAEIDRLTLETLVGKVS
jgi:hypothetical protein